MQNRSGKPRTTNNRNLLLTLQSLQLQKNCYQRKPSIQVNSPFSATEQKTLNKPRSINHQITVSHTSILIQLMKLIASYNKGLWRETVGPWYLLISPYSKCSLSCITPQSADWHLPSLHQM